MRANEFLKEVFERCNVVKNSYFCTYRNTELDYASFGTGDNPVIDVDNWFEVVVTPGGSEGLYLEIWMWHCGFSETNRICIGAVKTLEVGLTAHQDLGMLGGEMLYHAERFKWGQKNKG